MTSRTRLRRNERRHDRNKASTLNLTALMDIFTILVFFLLINSSNSQQLPDIENLDLPSSIADQLPEDTLTIQLSRNALYVQNKRITSTTALKLSDEIVIDLLEKELQYYANKKLRLLTKDSGPTPFKVTILGDKSTPYSLLKKVMATCAKNNYTLISLAVMKKASKS